MPAEVLYREMRIELVKREGDAKPDPRLLRFSVSSETPVMRWGDTEILRHDTTSLRLDRLRNLGCALVNHDPNQRAAAVESAEIVDKRLEVTVRFGTTAFAQDVQRDVTDGLLRGISVGYRVHTWEVDEDKRTYTATDWEPFEVTFTPIPADATVGVGRSASADWQALTRSISTTRAASAAPLPKESTMPDPIQPAAPAPAAAPVVVAPVVDNSEAVRAATIKETREVAELARSVDLDATPFIGMSKADAQVAIIRAMAEKNKTPAPKAPVVTMDWDQIDKSRQAFTAALAHRSGVSSPEFIAQRKDNPLMGLSIRDMVKNYLRTVGINAADWSDKDVGYYGSGKVEMMSDKAQRAVNNTVGSFPNFVFLNSISKIVSTGFERGSAESNYKSIVAINRVRDFKQFTVGGLGTGNIQKTLEGAAYPELVRTEFAYNSTVKMWGGTLSLSTQALISDDTGVFERSLRNVGPNADKAIDRRVFQKLMMGTSTSEATSTWTSNTTSGGSLVYTTADLASAARGKLSIIRAAFRNKIGVDGNPLGVASMFLVCGPTRLVEAQGITGQSGPILSGGVGQVSVGMQVIASDWLEASALTGNSTTTYYLLADPSREGLLLTFINGYESLTVEPYDAGAVGGMNWKTWIPFEADLINGTNTAGTTIIPGAHQGTT